MLKPLPFAAHSFDLVNGRFLLSFMPRTSWPALLAECRRLLRPGGILRLTEGELARALYEAGHSFTETSLGIARRLPRLLQQARFERVSSYLRVLDSTASPKERALFENNMPLLTLLEPFLLRWGETTSEALETLRQQVFIDLYQGEHPLHWPLPTVWGQADGGQADGHQGGGHQAGGMNSAPTMTAAPPVLRVC